MNEQNALFNKRLKYDMASSIQYLTNQLHHQQQQQQDINSVHHCLNPKKAYLDIIKSEMISPNDTNSTTRKTPPSEIYMNMPPNVPNRHQQTTPPTTTLNQATTLTRSTPKQQIKSLNRSIQENVNSNLLQTPSQSSHQQIDPPPSHFDNLALLQNLYKFKNVAEIFKLYSDDMQQAKSELEIDKHQLETDDQQKIHNNKNDFNEENVNSDNEYFQDLNRKTKKLRSFSISKTKKFKKNIPNSQGIDSSFTNEDDENIDDVDNRNDEIRNENDQETDYKNQESNESNLSTNDEYHSSHSSSIA